MSYNRVFLEVFEHGMCPFMPLLFGLVKERAAWHADFKAVELGVNGGSSTISMVTAVADANQGHVYSCDVVDCDCAAQLVYRAGCGPFWTFEKNDSVEYAKGFEDGGVDFVFLDTSHEYEQTVKEIAAWTAKLKPGGLMTFHDTRSRKEGVGKPIGEWLAGHVDWRYWCVDFECGFGVLEKP